jgi:hypothetical protein
METGNPAFIILMDDYFDLPKLSKKIYSKAVEFWDNLFDQYLNAFGLSEHSLKMLKWEIKICKLKAKMIEREDWAMNAAINIEEKKYRQEMELSNNGTLEMTTAYLEQHRKIALDPFKCSVKMFYTYVNMMNVDAKKQRDKNISKN